MNFLKALLISSLLFSFSLKSYSQCAWCYGEQVSGVTTSLNSVTMHGTYNIYQVWTCGSNGVVLKTTNQGVNWLNANTGGGIPSAVNLNSITCKAIDTALTAGMNGTTSVVYRTTNGGLTWLQVFSQLNGHINAVWMKNALLGFMAGNPVGGRWSLWKTTNGGAGWDSTGLYLPQAGNETGFNNSLAIVNNNIWFGTNNSRLYKSANFGLNWQTIVTLEAKTSSVWIYADTTGYVFAYIGGDNSYRTTTGGSTWLVNTCADTGNFVGFNEAFYGVDLNTPMGSYAVRYNNKIYFSFPGLGAFLAEYTAAAGYYNHFAYSTYVSYFNEPMYSWAVRSNGGITRISLFRGGAVNRISTLIPDKYVLYQNYPNPFNPSTKIRFDIPHTISKTGSAVELRIYDELGREVAVVANESLTAGQYEADFDASKLGSGIYYYRITIGDFSETKKMVLLK